MHVGLHEIFDEVHGSSEGYGAAVLALAKAMALSLKRS